MLKLYSIVVAAGLFVPVAMWHLNTAMQMIA